MRKTVKSLIEFIAMVLVLPAVVACRLGCCAFGPDRGFAAWSQLMSLFPGLSGQFLRRAFYRLVLPKCGEGTAITFGTTLSHRTAKIGRNVYLGANCSIGDATIEDDVLIASHVSVMNGSEQHGTARLDIPIREQPGCFRPVTIGEDSWIGERAIIAANVGRHCIIGAGAVVTQPIPDFGIAVGIPAKVVRFRE
ncbi:MAG: acyltransferase [Planctomycetota bacterium]|nr:acyltransferase [Planctomycetota bacterium]